VRCSCSQPTFVLTRRSEDYYKTLFAIKKSEGYWKWFAGNVASGSAAGATSTFFVYSLDYARTRLANDAKSNVRGGARQFNGLIDVYKKTLASDGVAGLYRGFVPSILGIVVYRGLYFGLYDSLSQQVNFICRLDYSFFFRARGLGRRIRRILPSFLLSCFWGHNSRRGCCLST